MDEVLYGGSKAISYVSVSFVIYDGNLPLLLLWQGGGFSYCK